MITKEQTSQKEQSTETRRMNARKNPAIAEPGGIGVERHTWCVLADAIRANWKLLAGLFVAALAVRFFRLGHSELWLDEVMVFYDARAGTNEFVSQGHRLHLWLVGLIVNTFGGSTFWIRSLSAFTGSLAVPATAIAGLWLGGRRVMLCAGVLALVNPFLVFYSQDANYYGTMGFFAALQLAFFAAFFQRAMIGSLAAIFVAGVLSYFNHPFSLVLTGLAFVGCFIGSLSFPSLRRELYAINPKQWKRRPFVPLLIVACAVGIPYFSKEAKTILGSLKNRILQEHQTVHGVEFSLDFFIDAFTTWGVTYHMRESVVGALVIVPVAFFIAGIVLLFASEQRSRASIAFGMLAVAVPAASFFAIFNLRHHGFYPRYFTYWVPVLILGIAWFCSKAPVLLTEAKENLAKVGTPLLLVIVLLVQVPFLAIYTFSNRAGFAAAAEKLAQEWQPGQPIYGPERNDWQQLSYYLGETSGRSIWPDHVTMLDPGNNRISPRRSYFLYHLYGQKNAWFLSGWRHPGPEALWDFLSAAMPPVFSSPSPHDDEQDALLHHWTYGDRVLLRAAATRFTDGALVENGKSQWFGERDGNWRLRALNNGSDETLRITNEQTGEMQEITMDGSDVLSVENDTVLTVTADAGASIGNILAEPVMPERFILRANEYVSYPDDGINRDATFDGIPVIEKTYDGQVAYVLYSPPGEERQLVLRTVRRNMENLKEQIGRTNANPELFFEVASDGVHLGTWHVPEGATEEIVKINTGVTLPPGNHRINIYGFTFRLQYDPKNTWQWAGLEYNTTEYNSEEQLEVKPSLESSGLNYVRLPGAILPWGSPGETVLPRNYFTASASYAYRVSPNVRGPSGEYALEFDLEREMKGPPSAYMQVIGPVVPAKPGQVLGFSTYVRLENTKTYAFQLSVVCYDAKGEVLLTKVGDQQLAKYTPGWRRFVEMFYVPPGVAAIAPGIMVFPPDPNNSIPEGKIHVDAMASLPLADEPFAHLNLDDALFFEPQMVNHE